MTGQPRQRARQRRWSPWSLLLLVPLLILVTPLFNQMEPTLIGMPFFYWVQFLFIPIGITCTAIAANRTRPRTDAATDETDAAGGEQR